MTADRKRKRALRDKAEKTGMSYAATAQALKPSVAEMKTKVFPEGFYYPPLSPAVVADMFAEIEALGDRVRQIRVHPRTFADFRKWGRDVMDIESDKARLERGHQATVWGAEVWTDVTVPFQPTPDGGVGVFGAVQMLHSAPTPVEEAHREGRIIDLQDDDLVIVLKAGQRVRGGLADGFVQTGPVKIYHGPKQMGLVQRLVLDVSASSAHYKLSVNFPDETSLTQAPEQESVQASIAGIRKSLPWASVGRVPVVPFKPKEASVEELEKQLKADLNLEGSVKPFWVKPEKVFEDRGVPYDQVMDSGNHVHLLFQDFESMINAIVERRKIWGTVTSPEGKPSTAVVLSSRDPLKMEVGFSVFLPSFQDSYSFTIQNKNLPKNRDLPKTELDVALKTASGQAKIAAALGLGATWETLNESLSRLGVRVEEGDALKFRTKIAREMLNQAQDPDYSIVSHYDSDFNIYQGPPAQHFKTLEELLTAMCEFRNTLGKGGTALPFDDIRLRTIGWNLFGEGGGNNLFGIEMDDVKKERGTYWHEAIQTQTLRVKLGVALSRFDEGGASLDTLKEFLDKMPAKPL